MRRIALLDRWRPALAQARAATIAWPATAAPEKRTAAWVRGIAVTLARNWLLVVVLAVYAGTALIVPVMTNAAVGDDWVYTRSVEILVHQHHLKVLDLAVVTLIFQVFWGALFAEILGMSFGAVRISTLAILFLSAIAFYTLCRELGVSRSRGALGTAAYLFNPLAYVMGFTFMSDPHFMAVAVIATALYARGLRPGDERRGFILAGSAAAAAAFLVRQEGALVPFAVGVYLLASGRLRINRHSLALLIEVAAIPVVTLLLYYVWLFKVNGVPIQQQSFLKTMRQAGWAGTWQLSKWMIFIATMYIGLFALPIAAAAVFRLPRFLRATPSLGWAVFAAWEAIVIAGVEIFAQPGHWPAGGNMPYIPQYLNPWGLGPPDIRGGRPWFKFITDAAQLKWVTIACACASLILVLAVGRKIRAVRSPQRAAAGLVLTVGLWQIVGMLPPSYHFRTWAVSMDRYTLPLLPFALWLGLWATRDLWLPQLFGWVVVAAFAVFAVMGTRDFLVFQGATWSYARQVIASGVPNTKLDAGAAWDGYVRWEYDNAHHIPPHTANGPWWEIGR